MGRLIIKTAILLQPCEFVTDPEDGIESVEVMSITLQSLVGRNRVGFERSIEEKQPIHELAQAWFEGNDPLQERERFELIQAVIFIHLFSDRTNEREEILSVRITQPNGCEIKSKNTQERLLVEKYIKRWDLIEEITV